MSSYNHGSPVTDAQQVARCAYLQPSAAPSPSNLLRRVLPTRMSQTVYVQSHPAPTSVQNAHDQDKNPGQTTVHSAIGFMSTSLPSLRLLLKSIISTEPWLLDPEVAPMPWIEGHSKLPKGPLCFGIFASDDSVTPHPPIARGIRIAAEAVRKAGHKAGLSCPYLARQILT